MITQNNPELTYSAPVRKNKEMQSRLRWTIPYKSLYFVDPSRELVPFFTGMWEKFNVRPKVLLSFSRVNNELQESQAWNILVKGLLEVTTEQKNSRRESQNMALAALQSWSLNRGLIYNSLLQLFWDFDYLLLNRGSLNGGSAVFTHEFHCQNFGQYAARLVQACGQAKGKALKIHF